MFKKHSQTDNFSLSALIEAINTIKEQYFKGDECSGYEPFCGTLSVADGTVKFMGHLFAASIVNGGPAPSFLSPWIYEFIVGGMGKAIKLCPREINPNSPLKEIFEKVNFL